VAENSYLNNYSLRHFRSITQSAFHRRDKSSQHNYVNFPESIQRVCKS